MGKVLFLTVSLSTESVGQYFHCWCTQRKCSPPLTFPTKPPASSPPPFFFPFTFCIKVSSKACVATTQSPVKGRLHWQHMAVEEGKLRRRRTDKTEISREPTVPTGRKITMKMCLVFFLRKYFLSFLLLLNQIPSLNFLKGILKT